MTGIYKTPKVLHIIEVDNDGNQRIVRYIREDTIEGFAYTVNRLLSDIKKECDKIEEQEDG